MSGADALSQQDIVNASHPPELVWYWIAAFVPFPLNLTGYSHLPGHFA